MATYKVIQDIEAEDKLIGPLTLKQFIFALVAATCAYLSFMALSKGASFLLVFLLPPLGFFGLLAWPWSKDQPTEIWLLGKVRFLVKPRRRIWDQSGLKQLVTITAPIQETKTYSDGLSQGEVKSRLKALANTIDSRGWAIKNVNVNLFANPQYQAASSSDRLLDPDSLPKEVVNYDVTLSDDILDEQNNPTAQKLDRMIHATSDAHRQQIIEQMKQPAASSSGQPADYWFLGQTSSPSVPAGQAMFDQATIVQPNDTSNPTSSTNQPTSDDQALLAKIQAKRRQSSAAYNHMHALKPQSDSSDELPAVQANNNSSASSSSPKDPAILGLANNDDLNVATIARQANKNKGHDLGDDEVVVPLH